MPPKPKKQELQELIADAQEKLDLFDTFPNDNYPVSTVALFSGSTGAKWFYLKLPSELWKPLSGTDAPKLLEEWIYDSKILGFDFEVYILTPGNNPIYATI